MSSLSFQSSSHCSKLQLPGPKSILLLPQRTGKNLYGNKLESEANSPKVPQSPKHPYPSILLSLLSLDLHHLCSTSECSQGPRLFLWLFFFFFLVTLFLLKSEPMQAKVGSVTGWEPWCHRNQRSRTWGKSVQRSRSASAPKECMGGKKRTENKGSVGERKDKTAAAAAAVKSLQSCPTLCDPRDGSPPGSSVPRILQARTLEWVAISFSKTAAAEGWGMITMARGQTARTTKHRGM